MPGLIGIIDYTKKENNEQVLDMMIKTMMYESDYHYGTFIEKSLGVYIGWVCQENTFSDCLPIWNNKKDKCLFFYGENYLNSKSSSYHNSNQEKGKEYNASYLIDLYEEKGSSFYEALNGFFHGVLIDLSKKEVILFNDRYGMQRIYYYENTENFVFSSEAKAMLKAFPNLRELNMQSLGQLIGIDCVLDNNTLFNNVYLLPGGSKWTFAGRTKKKTETYFNRNEWETQNTLSNNEFYERLKSKFINVIPKYFSDSRDIGVSLTGGLDTRMIMANANLSPDTVKCYTFGSMYLDSFDVKVARKVAKICKLKHNKISVGNKFLSRFPELVEKAIYISDGNIDAATGASELYLNQIAKKIAPVRITGNYGSEILRSIRALRYRPPDQNLFDNSLNMHIENSLERLANHTKGNKLSFTVFKQTPWYNYNRVCIEQSQLTWRTPFMDNDIVALVYRAPNNAVNSDRISMKLVKDGNKKLGRLITNRGVGGGTNGLFSYAMQRLHGALYLAEIAYDYSMPHWLCRTDYWFKELHLEKLFLGRNDFNHFRIWFRDFLSEYIKEILLDERTLQRPYINKNVIEKKINSHIDGTHNYVREISKILSIELMHRKMIDDI